MALTLTQEQQISSLLHYIINQTEHHNDFMTNSISNFLSILDADIVSQSGMVCSIPSAPGSLDNIPVVINESEVPKTKK
ncbi:MAG TPA: hypothetical protein VF974_08240 [Patescibacteria group bacterium]